MNQQTLLPRFNIAALPIDADLRQIFFDAAAGLRPLADGYLLEPGLSLPHLSLCHFRAVDTQAAEKIASLFVGRDLTLANTGIYLTAGTLEHSGKYWAGYIERRSPALMALQAQVITALRASAVEIFHTSGDGYFPHFTAARLGKIASIEGLFSPKLIGRDLACRVCLGVSDENGQLTKILAGQLKL